MKSYLGAYFGDRLPEPTLEEIVSAAAPEHDLEAIRDRLERSLQQVCISDPMSLACTSHEQIHLCLSHRKVVARGFHCIDCDVLLYYQCQMCCSLVCSVA